VLLQPAHRVVDEVLVHIYTGRGENRRGKHVSGRRPYKTTIESRFTLSLSETPMKAWKRALCAPRTAERERGGEASG
jgi:hypothetical protein